jgi:hypothetical protein
MKCGQQECEEQALVTVYWPSRTSVMCPKHAAQAQGLARHMGFKLPVRPWVERVRLRAEPTSP